MFKIDNKKCIGCALCIDDCFVKDIIFVEEKAFIKNNDCIKCGHCIAICPTNAIYTDEYDMNEVIDYDKVSFNIKPENLLNFIKFRRTIRKFKDKKVENEKLIKIIEAGRYTPTASNSQDVSYIIIQEKINELKKLVLESLNDLAKEILKNPKNELDIKYAKTWKLMYRIFKRNPNKQDNLFFFSKNIIIITSPNELNAGLASTNMELMCNSLGLGSLYSGFFILACKNNDQIRKFLNLNKNEKIINCMVIGYPDVKYLRTVPRKKSNITWL
ncbi:MAG: nitroreductase family protein [Fusobacterium sp. JB021]|nr:nitroreductase family protein [Fusobacterium sp. JB021]